MKRLCAFIVTISMVQCPQVKDEQKKPDTVLNYCYRFQVYQGESIWWARTNVHHNNQFRFFHQDILAIAPGSTAVGPIIGKLEGRIYRGSNLNHGPRASAITPGQWCLNWYAGPLSEFSPFPSLGHKSLDCVQVKSEFHERHVVRLPDMIVDGHSPHARVGTKRSCSADIFFKTAKQLQSKNKEQVSEAFSISFLEPSATKVASLNARVVIEITGNTQDIDIEKVTILEGPIVYLKDGKNLNPFKSEIKVISKRKIVYITHPPENNWAPQWAYHFRVEVKGRSANDTVFKKFTLSTGGPTRFFYVAKEKNADYYLMLIAPDVVMSSGQTMRTKSVSRWRAFAHSPNLESIAFIARSSLPDYSSFQSIYLAYTDGAFNYEYNISKNILLRPSLSWHRDGSRLLAIAYDNLNNSELFELNVPTKGVRLLLKKGRSEVIHDAMYHPQKNEVFFTMADATQKFYLKKINLTTKTESIEFQGEKSAPIRFDIGSRGQIVLFSRDHFYFKKQAGTWQGHKYQTQTPEDRIYVRFTSKNKIVFVDPSAHAFYEFADFDHLRRHSRQNMPKPRLNLKYPNLEPDYFLNFSVR